MKVQLRKQLKTLMSSLSDEQRVAKSASIVIHVRSLLTNLSKSHNGKIGLYYPIDEEPDCTELVVGSSLQFCWPRFDEHGLMEFVECAVEQLETKASFGKEFKVPPKKIGATIPEVLLIPGLGFDKTGARLGRGKGYYDRYLKNYNGVKIGICFEEMLLDKIPTDSHDVKMDYVVSEKGIINSKNSDLNI